MRHLTVIATMHGKERVLGPVLGELGMDWALAEGLDTDAFGTFTGDVARSGSQLDAARSKAEAALKLTPRARYALSSEGSFGPHPHIPLVSGGIELVYLLDRVTDLAVKGWHVTAETNYARETVQTLGAAETFAQRVGFPTHGLVIGTAEASDRVLAKGVVDAMMFESLTVAALDRSGAVTLASDMRAHVNPTRMLSIGCAARDMGAAWSAKCPACSAPGFVVKARQRGLPCRDCGGPTNEVSAAIRICDACGHKEVTGISGHGDPQRCLECNP
jgi:hypothetical protein